MRGHHSETRYDARRGSPSHPVSILHSRNDRTDDRPRRRPALAWETPDVETRTAPAEIPHEHDEIGAHICCPSRSGARTEARVRTRPEIVASVGVLEREKRYEQRIVVSAELLVRDDYDGVSDRLADVLDYSARGAMGSPGWCKASMSI